MSKKNPHAVALGRRGGLAAARQGPGRALGRCQPGGAVPPRPEGRRGTLGGRRRAATNPGGGRHRARKKASRKKPTSTKKPAAKHSPGRRTFLKGAAVWAANKATDGAVAAVAGVVAIVTANRLLAPPVGPPVRVVAGDSVVVVETVAFAGGVASVQGVGEAVHSVEPSA